MKQKKCIAITLLLALAFSLLQPSVTVLAASKNFTYAEQKTGATVKSLFLEPGQQVDLKFIGVSDYKNYSRKWTSSNEAVATVDNNGLITARAAGTATIKLNVGDGSAYTSAGVTVTVGKQNTIALGTSGSSTFSNKDLKTGSVIDLGFYGMLGWDSSRYTCAWVSTNPAVATVDQSGIVKALKTGRTFIMLLITDKYTTSSLTVTPVALNIVDAATPTVTPVPTKAPNATATPTPTKTPDATPTTAPSSGGYSVTVASTESIYVKFASKVSYEDEDITLIELEEDSDTEGDDCSFDIIWNKNGKEAVIETDSILYNEERYKITFGDKDEGTIFEVRYGEPNRIEVTYECMGQEGAAYAQIIEDMDMPVTLSYRLYHNNVDVTEQYDDGYVEFNLISPNNSSYIEFDDSDELIFYAAKKTAVVCAVYTYEKNGKDVTLKSANTSITSKSTGSYSLSISEWTIIEEKSKDDINWDKPVHKVGAGTDGHRIVLLLKDTFGTLYSTDERGVNDKKDIYSLEDSDTFFGAMGYSLTMESEDMDEVFVDEDGMLEVYEDAKSKAAVYLTLYNEYADDFNEKKVATFNLQILPAPELSSIKAETSSLTLATDCMDGFADRFCKAEIKIKLYDQYGEEWNGDGDLSVSCDNRDIDDALGGSSGPAYIKDNTLYLDAKAMWETDEDTSLTFTVKEEEINKKTTVKVTLKEPSYDSDDKIKVNGWEVSAEDVKITFEDEQYLYSSKLEVFQNSKSLNVGLFTDVTVLEKTSYSPDKDDDVGEVFVMVIDPDGDAVPVAKNENDLGAYWDSTDKCVYVNVAAPGGGKTIEFLGTGKYRIKAVRVTSKDDNGEPSTSSDTAYFSVSENVGEVKIKSVKSNKTDIYVDDKDDINAVAEIVEELFTFTLDGKAWEVTENMVCDAVITRKEKYIVIKSLELEVPIGDTGYSYIKTIKNINESIQHGVDD